MRVDDDIDIDPAFAGRVRDVLQSMVREQAKPVRRTQRPWLVGTVGLLAGAVAVTAIVVAITPRSAPLIDVACLQSQDVAESAGLDGVTLSVEPLSGSSLTADEALLACATLWEDGVLVLSGPQAVEQAVVVPQSGGNPADVDQSLVVEFRARQGLISIPLSVCVLSDGRLAVIPGQPTACTRSGLDAWPEGER